MYVCMYVCMYGCMYVCMYICMYVHKSLSKLRVLFVCTEAFKDGMNVSTYVYDTSMYTNYICMKVGMHACMYVCMYVHTYICMYI